MRPRINKNAICSSDNYTVSKRLHRDYLNATHEQRIAEISNMNLSETTTTTHNIGRPYTMVFSNKVFLSIAEAKSTKESGLTIHYE